MKKLVLLLAVVCSASLFSCGGKSDAEKAAEDSARIADSLALVQKQADSIAAAEAAAAAAQDTAAQDSAKVEEAK